MSTVLLERRGPAAWITLNRPDKLNAMNEELVRELRLVLTKVEADDEVKVVVLTGAGQPIIADSSALASHRELSAGPYSSNGENSPHPAGPCSSAPARTVMPRNLVRSGIA